MRVLKEPLLHFLLAGAALFGAYAWMNRAAENPIAGKAQQLQVGRCWRCRVAGGDLDYAMAAPTDT
jgi:hypothetical protein